MRQVMDGTTLATRLLHARLDIYISCRRTQSLSVQGGLKLQPTPFSARLTGCALGGAVPAMQIIILCSCDL